MENKEQISPVTQNLIDTHIQQLLKVQFKSQSYPYSLTEGPRYIEFNPEQPVLTVGDELPSTEDDGKIMLASVPKVAINLAMVNLLQSSANLNSIVQLDKDAVLELIGRDPKRIFSENAYSNLANVLKQFEAKLTYNITPQELSNLKHQISATLPQEFKLEVTLQELMYQALTLSSNNATRLCIQLIAQAGLNLNNELAKLVPNYTPSPISMQNLEHWDANLPNVGSIYEHAVLLHNLAQKLQTGTISATEQLVTNPIKNNSIDFGFDFTSSDYGKSLIAQGYTILEKTGYYPCVYWIKEFAAEPFNYPPHMVMCTIFSIVPPHSSNQPVVTYAYQQMYLVRLPLTTESKEINGVKVTYPEDTNSYVASVSNPIKNKVRLEFRNTLSLAVSQQF